MSCTIKPIKDVNKQILTSVKNILWKFKPIKDVKKKNQL
jgi:hypothetical protein